MTSFQAENTRLGGWQKSVLLSGAVTVEKSQLQSAFIVITFFALFFFQQS